MEELLKEYYRLVRVLLLAKHTSDAAKEAEALIKLTLLDDKATDFLKGKK